MFIDIYHNKIQMETKIIKERGRKKKVKQWGLKEKEKNGDF